MKRLNIISLIIVSFLLFTVFSFNYSGGSAFLTHGGGPYPILEPNLHSEMFDSLRQISQKYPSPKAIVMISAHWEEEEWSMLERDQPSLLYDYYGFPDEAYNLTYQIKSTKELRNEVKQHLSQKGYYLNLNHERGYDHGVFIPMMIMYSQQQLAPVIQLSIKKNLDPEEHYMFGKALSQLKRKGYLILGSGASSHGGFGRIESLMKSQEFSQDLSNIFMGKYNEENIMQGIRDWKKCRNSKEMHPREEHLVPLFVILGAYEGEEKVQMSYVDNFMKLNLRNYILN